MTKLDLKKNNRRRKKSRTDVFVARYLLHMNGARAAVEAGYSENSSKELARQLLAKPEIAEAVRQGFDSLVKRTEIEQEKVLRAMWDLATADPSELVQIRRLCCRYCFGKGHEYQRTQQEMNEALKSFENDRLKAQDCGQHFSLIFDPQGGAGFDHRRDPNPKCPECFGEGIADIYITDSRDLTPRARRLYASAKKTKEGFEIKMRDQDAALQNVAKHLGMFQTKVVHSNDEQNPLPMASVGVVMIPAKAASGAG